MAKTIRTTGKKEARRNSSKVATVKARKAFNNYKEALAYLLDRTDYEKEEHVRYNVTTFSLARMERLILNPDLRQAMAEYNRSFAQKNFAASAVARRLTEMHRRTRAGA